MMAEAQLAIQFFMSTPLHHQIDHIFICTVARAPAAQWLRQAGLVEGAPNQHPGQGTACRRFFFSNAMLELIWLENEMEARSQQTRATKLWERFSAAGRMVSPFGIILRPAPGAEPACPFRSWSYRPPTMPGLELEIAADAELEEPMWCYMQSGRPPAEWPPERRQPLEHPAGFRELTGVLVVCPLAKENSVTAAMARDGVIALQTAAFQTGAPQTATLQTGAAQTGAIQTVEHLLELQFDGGRRGAMLDFRPDLPLIFRA